MDFFFKNTYLKCETVCLNSKVQKIQMYFVSEAPKILLYHLPYLIGISFSLAAKLSISTSWEGCPTQLQYCCQIILQ